MPKTHPLTVVQPTAAGFDLFRLSKSKGAVDLCPNTIRSYFRAGLRCYRAGKAVFISRAELQAFIIAQATRPQQAA
jgi:hypothetical protein